MDLKIDVIVCWPRNCDYPLWRKFIKEARDLFNNVFIAFTETYQGFDYRDYVKKDLDPYGIFCFNAQLPSDKEDWRNLAINQALDLSGADWVWFTEQDLITNKKAIKLMIENIMSYQVKCAFYKEGDRIHPANLWVKREVIDQTSRDFSIVPDKLDHFDKFTNELLHANIMSWEWTYPNDLFYHMNGLSHNMALLERGEKVTYKPKEFKKYLLECAMEKNLYPDVKRLIKKGLTIL